MVSDQFQLYKVRRLIQVNGKVYDFFRQPKNEFGEPIPGDPEHICIRGIYHETTGYLSLTASDSTTIRKQTSPMILCTWEDAKNLKQEDQVKFNNKLYAVSSVKDVTELQIIADISLMEVQQ